MEILPEFPVFVLGTKTSTLPEFPAHPTVQVSDSSTLNCMSHFLKINLSLYIYTHTYKYIIYNSYLFRSLDPITSMLDFVTSWISHLENISPLNYKFSKYLQISLYNILKILFANITTNLIKSFLV